MIIRPSSLKGRMLLPEDFGVRGRGHSTEAERQPTEFLMNPYRFGGGGSPTDPYFSSVVLLVDTTTLSVGATSFVDVTGKTVTTVGDVIVKNDNLFLGSLPAAYFDGNGDRLSIPDSNDFSFGTGDFTVEAWVASNFSFQERYFFSQSAVTGGFHAWNMGKSNGNQSFPRISDGSNQYSPGTGGTWTGTTFRHVAISRVGNTLYSLFDGASLGSINIAGVTVMDSTGAVSIGAYGPDTGSTNVWNGWVAQARVTKGVGRYTGSYTPAIFPTS